MARTPMATSSIPNCKLHVGLNSSLDGEGGDGMREERGSDIH